jgi:hypothetical protein
MPEPEENLSLLAKQKSSWIARHSCLYGAANLLIMTGGAILGGFALKEGINRQSAVELIGGMVLFLTGECGLFSLCCHKIESLPDPELAINR